ncbi:Phosphorelay intermediate protein [Clarireedia jacksonii]
MSSTTKAETTTPKEKVVAPSPPSTAAVAASTSTTKTPAAPAAVVEPPRHDVDERESEEGSVGLPDLGDSIDSVTFEQILEMDDDEDEREFSRSIVFGFFEQAEQTFTKMDDALEEEDLATLSSLGHFLKGSSATLGLTKVKDSCEKIQHYGQKKDEAGMTDEPDEKKCLDRIKNTLAAVKEEYDEVEKVLKKFYAV